MTNTLVADKFHALHERLLQVSLDTKHRFFEFGSIMKEIRDSDLWVAGGYDSFEAYFSDPDLAFSRSSVYHAISLVENFPDWQKSLPEPPIRKLIMIVPHLTGKNKELLLEYAVGQSSSDLRYTLDNLGDGVVLAEHRSIPKVYRCSNCRGIKGVFHNDLCTCGWTGDQLARLKKLVEEVTAL